MNKKSNFLVQISRITLLKISSAFKWAIK